MDMRKSYERAAALYKACSKKSVLNEKPAINFIKDSRNFWYMSDSLKEDGTVKSSYTLYDYEKNEKCPLFDEEKVLELVKPLCEVKEDQLPLENVVFEGESKLYFNLKGRVGEYCYDTKEETLTRLNFELHNPDEATSPDKNFSVFAKDHNLFSRNNETGIVRQLTFDGCEFLDYGKRWLPASELYLEAPPMRRKPAVVWSPDGKYFITYRVDRRLLGDLGLVQSVPVRGRPRPNPYQYRYAVPGDEHILEGEVYIGNIEKGTVTKVLLDKEPIVLYLLAMFDADGGSVKWTKDTHEVTLVRYDRFFKTIRCIKINAETATAEVIMEETYKTFGFVEYYGSASQENYSEMSMRYLPKTNELLWHSEIDNWSTLWLIDLNSGEKKVRYTHDGETFRRLKYVDEENRKVYFTAGGVDKDIDPYYQELFVADMDSGERTCISTEKDEHFVTFQPEGLYYTDIHSTVQTLPETVVRELSGETRCHLETCDISKIQDLYLQPEPFEAIGRDGKTKIYGLLIKPADFDPNKKYPVVDYIYGGAQRINTPKAFQFNAMPGANPYGSLEYLAHLGFVGVIVDGFATPLRSKEIHDYIYEKAEECCGITDHVLAIKQLGERFSWIDTDRVGIWGASGGGYATARALLEFGDFYKVGVSLCGNHDQAIYHAHWGERWIGEYSEEKYHNQANHNFAKNLSGKLLIVHGDMDDNVHPAASIKLISALIEANKDFDSLIYPNSTHAVARFKYVMKRKWDYFVEHLMGCEPVRDFDILPAEEKNAKNKEEKV
ncbi:MAG: prolyl oligopeptidase family serine peptidase [Oscillospiraceae bacterium]|nr:prolyl oligopeptidase family serine peptidase [Oscillospiraceae bacterium]